MGLIPSSLVLSLLVWCISRCLFFLPDGSIATDFPDVWGDWSLHAAHSWWFAEQPFLRWFDPRILRFDETFSYPPLINLLSGLLLRTGFGFQASMLLPCLLFAAILGFSLNYLFRWAGASPWAAGVLSVLIFLVGGTRVIAALVSGAIPSLFEAASGGIKSGPLSQVWLTPLFFIAAATANFFGWAGSGGCDSSGCLAHGSSSFSSSSFFDSRSHGRPADLATWPCPGSCVFILGFKFGDFGHDRD